MFDDVALNAIKSDFPIFEQPTPTTHPLIYLDNAATALKPKPVIDAVTDILMRKTANIHRSVHFLGDWATESYESCRETVSYFINCEPNEVVFLKNSTEGLNLVAHAFANKGKVVSSVSEHHSNYLVWDEFDTIRLPIDADGQVLLNELAQILETGEVSLISLAHVSNVTGAAIDVVKVCELAKSFGVKVLLDVAQSAPHHPLDVEQIGCDFLVFSGHKLGSPTGVGVLFGKAHLLEEMGFWLKGGATVESVEKGGFKSKNAPWKFEAGTPSIESVAGLNAAILYLLDLDMETVYKHQVSLAKEARILLEKHIPQAKLLGSREFYSGPLSFYVPGISPHILARGISDRYSICVRSGFHCAQPLHEALGVPASLRISHWVYNSKEDLEKSIKAIADLATLVT